MMPAESSGSTDPRYTLHYLPPNSELWGGLLPQFILRVAVVENVAFANWAGERLTRATRKNAAMLALADGVLLGFVLFEIEEGVAEVTFPWCRENDGDLATALLTASLQVIQEDPTVRDIRAERQLLPDNQDTSSLVAAGFSCHWRRRMGLELPYWSTEPQVPPGYHLARWNILYLDAAVATVCAANAGTLDSKLYYTFFGDSFAECRKGVLSILAGRYGSLNHAATLCAFAGQELVGVNLVIGGENESASIIEISVSPLHQGKGIGRALMIAALRELKQQYVTRVELAVTVANTRALHLYESLGFTAYNDFPVCVWPRDGGMR